MQHSNRAAIASGLLLLFSLPGMVFAQPPAVPAAQPNNAVQPADAAQPPDPQLPADAGDDVDAQKRAQLTINNQLIDLKQDDELRRRLSLKIGKILREGVLDNSSRAVIDEWITWRLYRMTITEKPKPKDKPKPAPPKPPMDPMGLPMAPAAPAKPKVDLPPPTYQEMLAEFNKEFLQDIRGAARFQTNATKSKEFRKYLLDGIIKTSRAPNDLLKNNFYVRLNVVLLLSRLDIDPGALGGKGAVPYEEVATPLLDVIQDPEQHEAVKIAALGGLKRILMHGNADRNRKNDIALALLSQLEASKESMYWYPMRLVETLGRVDEPLVQKPNPMGGAVPLQQPFHVQALMETMRDSNRQWLVRSESAKSLGRISLHGGVNSQLIAHEVVLFCSEMAAAYNKDPNQFYWPHCFLNCYLAFKPIDADEKAWVLQVKPGTLITKFDGQKSISDAYGQVLPVVKHVISQPEIVDGKRTNRPVPDAAIQAATAWINENRPSLNRVAPGLPELEATKPMAANVAPEDDKRAFLAGDN